MARTQKKLLDHARDAADPTSEASLLRRVSKLEHELSLARDALRISEQKRKLIEQERLDDQERLELLLATQDEITARKLKRLSKGKPSGQATAIFCWNDWHLEERIDPSTIDGANEFNLEIAEQRINYLLQKQIELLDFSRKLSTIRDAVLWLGGDLINNHLHDEAVESNFLSPSEAILQVQDHIASGIDFLMQHGDLDRLVVITSFGNHGRSTVRRRISTGYKHSWEWLAYHNLSRAYRNDPKVIWQVGNGYHNWLTVQGYDVRFHHGDAIKFGGGVGGVMIPLRKKIAQWNKRRRADLDIIGHFHQYITSRDAIVCPCLCGFNAYAENIGAEYEPPAQSMHVIAKDYGQVLSMKVFVE